MAYDINVALERLEKNLQDISSAKQQVEDTVNASSQLQNVVNNYVASINDVLQETLRLKEEIGKMGNQKVTEIKEAVTAIEANCNTIITEFKKDTSDILADFVSQNNKLAKSSEVLNTFKKRLEQSIDMSSDLITKLEHTIEITAALKTKQDKISTDVLSIHHSLKESSESISKQCDHLSQRVDASRTMLADAMSKEFRRLFIQTEDIITKLEHTIEITAALKTKQDKISTDVLSIHNSLKESSESISRQCDQLSQRVDASRTMLADAMSKEFRRLFFQTEDIKKSISKNEVAIEKLGKQIADQYASNRKSILINRWLILIAILAPFALKVIRFIIHKF